MDGTSQSLFRCVPGMGLYFASLHFLNSQLTDGQPGPLAAVAMGVVARSFVGVTLIPITVVKTRFESGLYGYGSIKEAVVSIYSNEGIRGLTCGLVPTLLRDAPFSGLYFMFYSQTKRGLTNLLPDRVYLGPSLHFCCGLTAGLFASITTQPFDVIKTQMQLYPSQFGTFAKAVGNIYKYNGISGYFQGLVPRVIRRTLMAAMAWTVYEELMRTFNLS